MNAPFNQSSTGAPRSTRPESPEHVASPTGRVKRGAPAPTTPPSHDAATPNGTDPSHGAPHSTRPESPKHVAPPTGRVKRGAPTPRSTPPGKPPRNPGLRALIAAKRAWSEPLSPAAIEQGFLGWHARGYLPHHDVPGVTQFLTFRLDDALPASRRSEWEALLQLEDERERRKQLEAYLDRGFGECWLRRPAIARLMADALRFFDGERYRLDAWVVMPNHVHVLVDVWQTPVAKLEVSWKAHVAREANRLLGRAGRFWEREYWDTRIRDEDHLRQSRRYIENNPAKAKLVLDPADWPWSSAHARVPERSAP